MFLFFPSISLFFSVPDNKCHNQNWCVLFFTHINLVARVLACAHAITHIKWRRLLSTSFHPIITTETFQLSDPGIVYQDDTIPQLPCHISCSY